MKQFPDIYPRKMITYVHIKTYRLMLIVALFISDKKMEGVQVFIN